jgi:hypothetical protein
MNLNSIKTPKDTNFENLSHFTKSLFENSKFTSKKNIPVSHNILTQGNKSWKGAQSRNITNNLMNAKSQGNNLETFSFIRPQSMKGDPDYERRQRKKNSKKGKPTKKMPYDEVKEKFFNDHSSNSFISRNLGEDRTKRFQSVNKTAYK